MNDPVMADLYDYQAKRDQHEAEAIAIELKSHELAEKYIMGSEDDFGHEMGDAVAPVEIQDQQYRYLQKGLQCLVTKDKVSFDREANRFFTFHLERLRKHCETEAEKDEDWF